MSDATFGSEGTYVISVTVSDGSLTASDTLTVSVSQVLVADSDNDGVIDSTDRCKNTPIGYIVNKFGCSKPRYSKFTISPNLETTDTTLINNLEISTIQEVFLIQTLRFLYLEVMNRL